MYRKPYKRQFNESQFTIIDDKTYDSLLGDLEELIRVQIDAQQDVTKGCLEAGRRFGSVLFDIMRGLKQQDSSVNVAAFKKGIRDAL